LTTKNVQGHTFPPDRPVFWHKVECKKVRTGKPDGLFCTRSEIPPVRYSGRQLWRRTAGGGEGPAPDISYSTRRKRFQSQKALIAFCNHIV